MKKFSLLVLTLALVIMISACGIPDAIGGDLDAINTDTSNDTVGVGTEEQSDTKDEVIDNDSKSNTSAVSNSEVIEDVISDGNSMADAKSTVKKFSSADFYIEEYDVDYCFINKAEPDYDFTGKVIVDGIELTLPCSYSDLEEVGITSVFADDMVTSEMSGDFDLPTGSSTAGGSEKRISLAFYNPDETERAVRDCRCFSIQFVSDDGISYNVDGITDSMTNIIDVIEVLGEPTQVSYYKLEDGMCFTFGVDYIEQLQIDTDKNGEIRFMWFSHDTEM